MARTPRVGVFTAVLISTYACLNRDPRRRGGQPCTACTTTTESLTRDRGPCICRSTSCSCSMFRRCSGARGASHTRSAQRTQVDDLVPACAIEDVRRTEMGRAMSHWATAWRRYRNRSREEPNASSGSTPSTGRCARPGGITSHAPSWILSAAASRAARPPKRRSCTARRRGPRRFAVRIRRQPMSRGIEDAAVFLAVGRSSIPVIAKSSQDLISMRSAR